MGATARESLGFWRSFRGWTQRRKGREIIESIYIQRERERERALVVVVV